ncbi:hypothetical protein ACS0TY_012673 [Phlomoides rotata]
MVIFLIFFLSFWEKKFRFLESNVSIYPFFWLVVCFFGNAGTRFRPLSLNIPKPLFPLAGQPMVNHPISACKRLNGEKTGGDAPCLRKCYIMLKRMHTISYILRIAIV